jgi:hypothetical protein
MADVTVRFHGLRVSFREMPGVDAGRVYMLDEKSGLPAHGYSPLTGVVMLAAPGSWGAMMANNLAEAYRPVAEERAGG